MKSTKWRADPTCSRLRRREALFWSQRVSSNCLHYLDSPEKIPKPHACLSSRNNALLNMMPSWPALSKMLISLKFASHWEKFCSNVDVLGSLRQTPIPRMNIDTPNNHISSAYRFSATKFQSKQWEKRYRRFLFHFSDCSTVIFYK